nr:retrovirus-related Pol polyprotein from transposon TNT 1-94 [Tanacetum cinerariifolium]
MTGNMLYLSDFKEFDGEYVTFEGGAKGGKITGKGTLKTGKLDFEDVYFVKELKFNLFSVSQMAIGIKWIYKNKKDERGIVVRNKAKLVAQGYTQEEEIDYDEVFASVARIEATRLFLAYASFKDFFVYQMSTRKELCTEFEKMIHKKFQMSFMRELT